MKIEKTLDGVMVVMSGEGLKKSRVPGYVAVFKESFSDEEIGVTAEQIKSIKSVIGGSCFSEVKTNRESTEAWNIAFDGVDFIGHMERKILHAHRFASKKSAPAVATTMQIKTPSGAIYRFPVEFRHDVKREKELSLSEAYRRFGFNLSNKKTRTIVAEYARLEGFSSAELFVAYLQQLSSEYEKVDKILDKVLETLSKNTPEETLPMTAQFLASMSASVKELGMLFKERCEKQLHGLLNAISQNSLIVRGDVG